MSSNKIKFENVSDAINILLTARDAEDWDLSREALTFICDNRPLEEMESNLLFSIESTMDLFGLFVETGLDCAEDGTPTRNLYLKAVQYILNHQTPEIKAAMDTAFHHVYTDLKPAGYDDNGQPCYAMQDVCGALGCTEKEAMESLKRCEGGVVAPDKVHLVQ